MLLVVLGRRPREPSASALSGRRGSSEVVEALDRAVAGGLLNRESADAILSAELTRVAAMPAGPLYHPVRVGGDSRAQRVPPVAEAIGYVGSILVLVGMTTLVSRFWEDLATGGRLAVVGGAALLLLVVGLLLRDEDDDVIWRLRSFVLLLSAGALGGFVAVLTVDALSWEGEPVAIAIGSAVALYGAALWQLKNRPAQQLTTLVGLIIAVSGVMYLLDGEAAVGLSVFAIGAVWLALGMQDRLPPALVATALGCIAVLVGPAVTVGSWEHAAPVMGLTVATGLVALGTWKHEFVLTGFGVIGLFGFLPWTLGALFGDAAGPPVILLVSGVLLLTVMLLLLRAHGGAGGSSGSGSGLAPPGSLLPH